MKTETAAPLFRLLGLPSSCQLGSHTSHKTQPCDVDLFGPLKTAYREQAERLFRGGADMIGKQHFTLLYDRARTVAFTPRNIKSGWFNSGLVPLNPARVLNARIMTYDDIVEAEQKRAAKVSVAGAKRGGRRPKSSKPGEGKRSRADELEISKGEIKAFGLEEYCSVLQF